MKTVKIGNQDWMAENLNVDHYRNGDPIPQVQDEDKWAALTTGAWCYYENDPANGAIYGKLYNWYAVNDPRGLEPQDWHIPSDDERQTLVDYLGGDGVAGGKMKESGIAHWEGPNIGATNESEFSALPGGYRGTAGNYDGMGYHAYFWSSTELGSYTAWARTWVTVVQESAATTTVSLPVSRFAVSGIIEEPWQSTHGPDGLRSCTPRGGDLFHPPLISYLEINIL